ncbi:hypothetical protein KTN05_01245 [Paracoccus sp. Z118]|uniref:hypothetical protein n=1 Tax=Paracoccus sp. Z118 TaxID=2851017 RepID=UPI001C2C07AB|nr:hypothetical protein [Paracoccus sp. Z118]MBV0890475.1 hypothetical protein [Paracoccus sp. Z118]
MIVIAAIILGALLGDRRARKAGGNRSDRLQYAAAHALAFALVGLFATIAVDRWMR